MKARIKNRLADQQGVTMIELIISIVVISIITVAVTTVFSPMLRTFQRAHSIAEANAMMDSIAMLMLDDINNAVRIATPPAKNVITIEKPNYTVTYTVAGGIIMQTFTAPGVAAVPPFPLFDAEFYRRKTVSFEWTINNGIITLSLRVDGPTELIGTAWHRTREYVTRPLGLR
jgi:prepilin-type N-terminal cleavage/methylation domain-containing protein